ncbi:conserved hypothetical protein [Talaromyces stipitatus ATCC 10500]|uniref:Uncharacterized protein n=1 Tax=Talaromyces stipitatus (strain ATCC 10500 / CBS 375.48 / QM 6759 / NRRL 1006) TaxID=441959 RepID=B8LTR0_TALSN|nr:uncharacterized protein TSTA_070620 [Talaromyces stipitatus ATCC 10500]EED23652.1 conserved hypothetical protein [Talaromyces stipitatus ATCC 10500]
MPHRHGIHHVHRRNAENLIKLESLPLKPAPTISEPPSVVRRASSETSTCSGASCEKSSSSGLVNTLPVVLGVVIPVVAAIIVLLILHRRHVRKLRQEDANDKHKSLDFGMEVVRAGGGNPKQPEMGEKPHKHGMSLDIIGSPYLLPPGLHNSKESLRSLTKVISVEDDKYRVAAQSDTASLRSHRTMGNDDASSFGGSTRHGPIPDDMNQGLLQNASRMSRSPPVDASSPLSVSQTIHEEPFDHSNAMRNQSQNHQAVDSHMPPEDLPKNHSSPAPSGPGDEMFFGSFPQPNPNPLAMHPSNNPNEVSHPHSSLSGFDFGTDNTRPADDHHEVSAAQEKPAESHNTGLPRLSLPMSETSDYGDEPKVTLPPSLNVPQAPEAEDHSHESEDAPHPPNNRVTQSFTKFDEGFDPHRLTVGIRPLPPEDPSDNAEQRANRIRSFYKEYFDDSKGGNNEEYYEDFGPEFYDDPGVFDPYSSEYFTGPSKPFAQPVGRRAMTPPPRFQGPPRNVMHPAIGSRAAGPRAFSSASGRLPVPRATPKRAPPPEPLHVLPSPHLIKDDMSILPIDYAPPSTFKDRTEGRPESPRGGLRPYTSMSRAHTPLVSSFDDLAAIPSPHALRKSGIYTTLDFAPPARFKNDIGSDAGSIRSNRTGISAIHDHNIRAGAYRVSRLPTDVVGTKDDLFASLRPNMDLGR